MDKTRRRIIIIYCIAVAAVCVIVPWKAEIAPEGGPLLRASVGYSPIWSPPESGYYFMTVDYSRIILKIIAITALAVMIMIIKQRST